MKKRKKRWEILLRLSPPSLKHNIVYIAKCDQACQRKKIDRTYRDALEACVASQVPEQLSHLNVVVRKIFNASPPAYN